MKKAAQRKRVDQPVIDRIELQARLDIRRSGKSDWAMLPNTLGECIRETRQTKTAWGLCPGDR